MTHKTASLTVAFALALFSWGTPGRVRADLIYNLNIDTSTIAGTSGYLDLQFNPTGGTGVLTAAVTSLTGDASVGSFMTSGNVQGTAFPLVFTADNSVIGQINDAYASATFGNSLGFTVDISTPDNISTASFQVTLYDQDYNVLLSPDPSNPFAPSVAELNLAANPSGSAPTVTTIVTPNDGTLTPAQAAVPEPGAAILAAEALGCLVLLIIARKKHPALAS
jgi:hypothetical protein